MRPAAALLALAALLLAACGGEDTTAPGEAWSVARVAGAGALSDVAILGDDLLLVSGGNDRTLRVVPRRSLAAGATLAAASLPIEVAPAARIGGSDPFSGPDSFVARGYQAGDLWEQPVDLVGVAAELPDVVWVAERTYRVVYWGKVTRSASGTIQKAALDRAFGVPGGERAGRTRSDWRDTSGGLAGMTTVPGVRSTEDLVLVDRQGSPASTFRAWQVDRFGILSSYTEVHLPAGVEAAVGDVAVEEPGRLVVVRGPGAGVLSPFSFSPNRLSVEAGPGLDGPSAPGVAAWAGIARSPDGFEVLVGGDAVAWRVRPVGKPARPR